MFKTNLKVILSCWLLYLSVCIQARYLFWPWRQLKPFIAKKSDFYEKQGTVETFSLHGEGPDKEGHGARCEMMGDLRWNNGVNKWNVFQAKFDLSSIKYSTNLAQVLNTAGPHLMIMAFPGKGIFAWYPRPVKTATSGGYMTKIFNWQREVWFQIYDDGQTVVIRTHSNKKVFEHTRVPTKDNRFRWGLYARERQWNTLKIIGATESTFSK